MLRTIGAYTSIAIENSKIYASIEQQNFILFKPQEIGSDDGSKIKLIHFMETIQSISNEPMPKQKEILEQKLAQWKGSRWEQTDDILIIGIEV